MPPPRCLSSRIRIARLGFLMSFANEVSAGGAQINAGFRQRGFAAEARAR